MQKADLCTEEEITQLVHTFYAAVREDDLLGPIFAEHVADWDVHLPKMIDFWSSALRGSARYRGMPMPVHSALPGLSVSLFQRWLQRFRETTASLPNVAMRERANDLAKRIAQSLWYGYQIHHRPEQLPAELAANEVLPTP